MQAGGVPRAPTGKNAAVPDQREGGEGGERRLERSTRLTLQAAGITLIGVILSISLTVGFGLEGPIWMRVAAGAATGALLLAAIRVGSTEGAALRRAADWVTGARER